MRPTLLPGLLALLLGAAPAGADSHRADAALSQRDEIEELKRVVGVLSEEIAELRERQTIPAQLEDSSELGSTAAVLRSAPSGLSIGGYAEGYYQHQSGSGADTADALRTSLYLSYKFTDRILFSTEIEFEHATTGTPKGGEPGSVAVELATLDFLLRTELNIRTGLLLLPMGFLNQVHDPPFYYGTQRPEAERRIIPTTWRENGIGIFGRLGENLHYRAFVVNGLLAAGFDDSGLRGGRQNGNRANFNNPAFVARVDLTPAPGLLVGGSYYVGDSGADQVVTSETTPTLETELPDVLTSIWELHAQYQRGPLQLRGLWTQAHLGDAGELSTALGLADKRGVSRRSIGGYAEASYDVMPLLFPSSAWGLEPFFRFEYIDTQNSVPSGFTVNRAEKARLFIPGLSFRPHPNVVLKFDYRNIDDFAGEEDDEFNFGFGVVF
ncbi:MAG: hypothetical protein HRU00_14790 [Myxococcales bacterium]|nr:hypothetical protein [Myxococcales bacterium]